MSLPTRFLDHVRRRALVPVGARLVLACSGGADSTALVRLVATCREQLAPAAVTLAHLDHGLRPESARECEAAAALARDVGFEPSCQRREVRPAPGESPEEAARRVRYAFLGDVARAARATHVLTAHHMDDQAETVLQRVLRGTGPDGLVGIPATRLLSPGVRVVRPLLPFRKRELCAWLRANEVAWCEDPGNVDGNERARLRTAGIPSLAACVGRDPVPLLARLAANAADSRAPSEQAIAAAFVDDCPSEIVLHAGFARLPRVLRAAAIREAAPRLRGGTPLTRDELVRLLALVGGDDAGVVAGLSVERRAEAVAIVSTPDTEEAPAGVVLTMPGATTIWDGRSIAIDVENAVHDAFLARLSCRDGTLEIVAADRLRAPFTVRTRRDGDRFRPLGWTADARLTHVLGRRGVPASERARLPLVCDGEGIVWAAGVAIADRVQVTAATRRIAVLRIGRL